MKWIELIQKTISGETSGLIKHMMNKEKLTSISFLPKYWSEDIDLAFPNFFWASSVAGVLSYAFRVLAGLQVTKHIVSFGPDIHSLGKPWSSRPAKTWIVLCLCNFIHLSTKFTCVFSWLAKMKNLWDFYRWFISLTTCINYIKGYMIQNKVKLLYLVLNEDLEKWSLNDTI